MLADEVGRSESASRIGRSPTEVTTTISQTTDAATEGLTSETSCHDHASIVFAIAVTVVAEVRATTCGRPAPPTTAEMDPNAAVGKITAYVTGQDSPFRGPMAISGPSIGTTKIANFTCNKGEVTPLLDDST